MENYEWEPKDIIIEIIGIIGGVAAYVVASPFIVSEVSRILSVS